ncbi:MAG TPA: 30S ribosomal protein S4 [Actinomycetota bacterium]|nr:30S ribosomal protein S4 [Actinomycetota bacterium]
MARYTGPDCRLCRREKMKLFLKGTKCETPKCPIEKRPFPPGQHGRGRTKDTEYLLQLREKQRARRIYGVLERQFRNYYDEATRMKGITGENLLKLLEVRLDNAVFRAGFALSRDQARQLVRHGHVTLNGKRASIPSMRVRVGDVIAMHEKSKRLQPVLHSIAVNEDRSPVDWLSVDREGLSATVRQLPDRSHIDVPVQEQMIVELYSK